MHYPVKCMATFLSALSCLSASKAFACKLSLILAMDVSSSIDEGEYRYQVDGLADALLDPVIADVLIQDQIALAVVQWSGAGEVELSIPWRRMLSEREVLDFAARVRALDRKWETSNTAPGDAIKFSAEQFESVSDCQRKVIDVSGDGAANAGLSTANQSRLAHEAGITINGLAIDIIGQSITEFYMRFVVTKGGFVETSRGFSDFPRTIKRKLMREIITPTM